MCEIKKNAQILSVVLRIAQNCKEINFIQLNRNVFYGKHSTSYWYFDKNSINISLHNKIKENTDPLTYRKLFSEVQSQYDSFSQTLQKGMTKSLTA